MIDKKRNTRQRFLIISLLVLSTSACSIFSPAEPEISDAEACLRLNELITDHADNFKQFKRGLKNTGLRNSMQIWDAERVFPLAKNCQVWEWSSGLTNYFCAWDESNQQEAQASYIKGVDLVNQCLGEQWNSKFSRTKSGGGDALFYQTGGKTVISIRYFKEALTILENWQTTLYVGAESNLKAKIQ
ncbi:hypothetical protein AU255_13240 [Methyloprofundus sedimenti]|uniref:Uncharacterized protein n=1 Tax=Methyloprofundus sedimenti TaxID=1420851 RepID=A0A1V8M3H6_9GAMM|nr:hypothetical protein [Methyloprofundus sedimenti]OQK16068.1 hypothetical protein AU255_13240 [Methyloprofundus sedimenti]